MKSNLFIFLILLIEANVFAQNKSALEFFNENRIIGEVHSAYQSSNVIWSSRHYLNADFWIDYRNKKSNFRLFSNVGWLSGKSISDAIGDIYLASSIDGLDALRIQNLWLSFQDSNESFEIRIGKQAVDDEFIITEKSNLFIHGAAAYVFTLSMNAPQWPAASWAVYNRLKTGKKSNFLLGIYGSDPKVTDESINTNGLDFDLNYSGIFTIAEWSQTGAGSITKFGYFRDSNRFGYTEANQNSLSALYFVHEKAINPHALGVKLTYHVSGSHVIDRKTAPIDYDIRAALFAEHNLNDKKFIVGLGYFYPHISAAHEKANSYPLRSESFGELTAKIDLSERLALQISLQKIAGAGAYEYYNKANSILGVMRFYFSF